MTFDDVLWFVNLFTSGITAGILVIVMAAVMPAILSLSDDDTVVRFKRKLDPLIDRINPACVLFSMITGVLILIVVDDLPTTATVATIVGVVGSTGVAATSMSVNMRINRRMAAWPADAPPPPEFRSLIERWNKVHVVRTISGVTAFVAYLIAVLAVID